MKNPEDGKVDQFDLGHAIVEKVVGIINERVSKRRGYDQKGSEGVLQNESQRLKVIEEDVKNIKLMILQTKQAVEES